MTTHTIEIYDDLKIAKSFCNKEQKVIKVPNTEVFKIVAPILRIRGISRIVSYPMFRTSAQLKQRTSRIQAC